MHLNLRRKLYPLLAGIFALSLMLSACGGGSDEITDPGEAPPVEEPAAPAGG